jgi:hypothetical protein
MKYTLTADMDGAHERASFDEETDTDAAFEAMAIILDLAAADKEGPWALGRVVLSADGEKRVLHVMESK